MRRPETVAATALVVGQPLGPRSVALPGRTRTGLTAICGGWPEVGAVPLADAGVLGAAGGGVWVGGAGGAAGGVVWVGVAGGTMVVECWSVSQTGLPPPPGGGLPPPGGMPQTVTVFTTGLASPSLHWITYEHV